MEKKHPTCTDHASKAKQSWVHGSQGAQVLSSTLQLLWGRGWTLSSPAGPAPALPSTCKAIATWKEQSQEKFLLPISVRLNTFPEADTLVSWGFTRTFLLICLCSFQSFSLWNVLDCTPRLPRASSYIFQLWTPFPYQLMEDTTSGNQPLDYHS